MSKQNVLFRDLGRLAYKDAWDLQEKLLQETVGVKAAIRTLEDQQDFNTGELQTRHHLLFVEHPPVYTLGKSGSIDKHIYKSLFLLSKFSAT